MWNHTVSNHPIHQHGRTNFWYVCLLERVYFNSKNAAIKRGMYIINGVHVPEPRSSGGNASSNPQVSALISRPAFNGMEGMCHRHGSTQNSHPPVLVRKPLCNQFIHYHISSRGVFGINHIELRNFAVVAIDCSFATVGRGSRIIYIYNELLPQAKPTQKKNMKNYTQQFNKSMVQHVNISHHSI